MFISNSIFFTKMNSKIQKFKLKNSYPYIYLIQKFIIAGNGKMLTSERS